MSDPDTDHPTDRLTHLLDGFDRVLATSGREVMISFRLSAAQTFSYGVTTDRIGLRLSRRPDLRAYVERWLRALSAPGLLRDFGLSRAPKDRLLEGNYFDVQDLAIHGVPQPTCEIFDADATDPDWVQPTAGSILPEDMAGPAPPGFDLLDGREVLDSDPVSGRVILSYDSGSGRDDDDCWERRGFEVLEPNGTCVLTTGATGRGRGFAGAWMWFIPGADGMQARISTSDGGDDDVVHLPPPAQTLWSGLAGSAIADLPRPGGPTDGAIRFAQQRGHRYLLDEHLRTFRLSRGAAGANLIPPNAPNPVRAADDDTTLSLYLHLTLRGLPRLTQTHDGFAMRFNRTSDWPEFRNRIADWINALAPGPVRIDRSRRIRGGNAFSVAHLHLFTANPWCTQVYDADQADHRDLLLI
ncbi:hypothetical protein G5B38_17550 [Pseudohalocynthiibacter aestuariivivens]|nr:hypothetical protein [Pseudohalocynthiibacter aestuariivivens]QIE47183.1 hypothetical protein G5B38_17550 [Pseudohalocynthiibacter aestuariivivens]